MNIVNKPFITTGFHISIDPDQKAEGYCVYRLSVGTKYLIQKGKALFQSAQTIATLIERGCRLKNIPESDPYYKLVSYIDRFRINKGYVTVLADSTSKSHFEILKFEQEQLIKAQKDKKNCLNNSFDAYVPQWINEIEAQKFYQWKGLAQEDAARKRESRKKVLDKVFDITYYNATDKDNRGVFKLVFGEKYYIGRAKLLREGVQRLKKLIKSRLTGETSSGEADYLRAIVAHINASKAKVATCILIKECATIHDLVREEQIALDLAKNDPNCLNIGFHAKPIHNEKDDTLEEYLKTRIIKTKGGRFVKVGVKKK